MSTNPVLVAIDTADAARAASLIAATAPSVGGIKLGLEFFSGLGPAAVREAAAGRFCFLDLKLHDIPTTVARAVRALTPLGPDLLTIHASGGPAMLRAARDAAETAAGGGKRIRLLGVTVLTSFDDDDLEPVGQHGPIRDQALRLAALAQECGLDGAVCAAREVAMLRAECGPDFVLVVPGIRPEGADSGDQKRAVTPQDAIAAGATHIVIGRPITAAADPAAAARAIAAGLGL
jgi:orotidine-5'-phosphate decarboxylase